MTTHIMAASENPLLPNGWEMLITAIGFFILLFVAIKWIVPMFERTYAERSEAIEGGLAKAEQAQAEADELAAEVRRALEALEEDGADRLFDEIYAEPHQELERQRREHALYLQQFDDEEAGA